MRALIVFLFRHNYLLLFCLLQLISLTLLIQFNHYQRGVFFTSANAVIGRVQEVESTLYRYIGLQEDNSKLVSQNTQLIREITALQKQANTPTQTPIVPIDLPFIKADVVNNSLWSSNNYITLNKGTKDGVRVGQGVLGSFGVVGIVYMTSAHYSVALSLLHSQTRLSCKLTKTEYFGTLLWDEKDPRYMYLEGIPRHAQWKRGDRVVTSGYSDVFPAGLMVGHIETATSTADGLAYRMKVRLSTDFSRLANAYILQRDSHMGEQTELEQRVAAETQEQ
jgi:rod shape-determining protein MreC